MCAQIKHDEKPSLLFSLLQCKCTRCRKGNIYQTSNSYDLKNFMKMNERCPVCGQLLDLEPGFYYGTNMISYVLAFLMSVATFLLWWVTIGFSFQDNRLFWWIGVNAFLLIALQPPLMRISRTLWLAFFVRYSPRWIEGDVVESERINKEQMANW